MVSNIAEENRSNVTSNGNSHASENIPINGDANKNEGGNGVLIAGPDSTTPNYGLNVTMPSPQSNFNSNMILTPCGWPSPCRAPPQPHTVKTINLMVNNTSEWVAWSGLHRQQDMKPTPTSTTPIAPLQNLWKKCKIFENQQKPPRFMKMESPEAKPVAEKSPKGAEESYAGEVISEPIAMAMPYTPPYAVQYRVPGYSVQPIQEPVTLEPAPLTPVGYTDHPPHYIEPPYTIPYTVYPHPQYYYQN